MVPDEDSLPSGASRVHEGAEPGGGPAMPLFPDEEGPANVDDLDDLFGQASDDEPNAEPDDEEGLDDVN